MKESKKHIVARILAYNNIMDVVEGIITSRSDALYFVSMKVERRLIFSKNMCSTYSIRNQFCEIAVLKNLRKYLNVAESK